MNLQDNQPEFYSNNEQPPRKVFLERYLPSEGFPAIGWRLTPRRMPPLRMSSGESVVVRACDG